MAHAIIALIAQYGLLLVFFNVLVEQTGVPVPAVPTLVVAGALAASAQLSLGGVLLVTLLACLLADLMWYWAGRHFGAGVMRTLCRISLSPDTCVRKSERHFQRWSGQVLLVAKFVPGLSTVAPPMVGAMGLPVSRFVLLDGLGSLLWAGVAAGLGYMFHAQIDRVLAALANAGTVALAGVFSLFALYILAKWWQRRRLLRALRMARITADELNHAMHDRNAPLVIDARSEMSRMLDTRIIPGAMLADVSGADWSLRDIPLDHELVIYCNCPNEVSAAKVAKAMMERGYRHVRPLQGGLDAWSAAGYTVQYLPQVSGVPGDDAPDPPLSAA